MNLLSVNPYTLTEFTMTLSVSPTLSLSSHKVYVIHRMDLATVTKLGIPYQRPQYENNKTILYQRPTSEKTSWKVGTNLFQKTAGFYTGDDYVI